MHAPQNGRKLDARRSRPHLHWRCSQLETTDDAPLYVFDSAFAERETTRSLGHDYALPRFFTDDLFKLLGERRRPPYRWFVLGPERSGSYIHIDPLGTSAWNALLAGHKCWACFPPSTPKDVVQPLGGDHKGGREAIAWFAYVYPTLVNADDPSHRPFTVIQCPGETMFIPGGWWHVVLNLDVALAVTQNFCSRSNFDAVWAKTLHSRPKLAKRFQEQLRTHEPGLYSRSLAPSDVGTQESSSSSSSSSSYSSSSAEEHSEDADDTAQHGAPQRSSAPRAHSRSRSRSPTWRERARERVERDVEDDDRRRDG